MNTHEAIEIVKALSLLSKTLNIEFRQACVNICLLDEDKYKILQNAVQLYVDFQDMNIVDRGKALGITVHERPNEGWETEPIVLSEN